jgi:hypothetical protein
MNDELRFRRLERFQHCLACTACGGGLSLSREAAVCRSCGASFPVREGRLYFVTPPSRDDALDDLKGKLKKWLGRYYYTVGVDLLAPTFPLSLGREVRRIMDPAKVLVVDAGSGNRRIDDGVLCLDFFDYDEVDVVCDVTNPPLQPGSVDAVVTRGLLEHLQDPFTTVRNFFACTRSGGRGMHLVPFLFPFHASPHDYFRFTNKGLEELFKGYEVTDMVTATGPFTLFLVNLEEFLATLLSFGNDKLKGLITLASCAVLFPLKFLDWPFVRGQRFLGMAPTILTTLRKP